MLTPDSASALKPNKYKLEDSEKEIVMKRRGAALKLIALIAMVTAGAVWGATSASASLSFTKSTSMFGINPTQTTEFTYQGRFTDGDNPADSLYDFEFKLFDQLADGSQQGSTAQLLNVEVKRGVFTVQLDFGNQYTGASRYLEISLRPAGPGAFTLLTPRQPITSHPYAIKSLNSSTADGLSLACVNCVANSQIQSVQGSKVTGSISGGQINGFIPVASIPAGSNSYIQNGARVNWRISTLPAKP